MREQGRGKPQLPQKMLLLLLLAVAMASQLARWQAGEGTRCTRQFLGWTSCSLQCLPWRHCTSHTSLFFPQPCTLLSLTHMYRPLAAPRKIEQRLLLGVSSKRLFDVVLCRSLHDGCRRGGGQEIISVVWHCCRRLGIVGSQQDQRQASHPQEVCRAIMAGENAKRFVGASVWRGVRRQRALLGYTCSDGLTCPLHVSAAGRPCLLGSLGLVCD